MFKFSNEDIYNKASFGSYLRGEDLLKHNAIKSVKFYPEQKNFSCRVQGSDIYKVNLILNDDWNIDSVWCTCHSYRSYTGYCRHIIAVLLFLLEQDEKGVFNKYNTAVVDDSFFNEFDDGGLNQEKQNIVLKKYLHVNSRQSIYKNESCYLELKTGMAKAYVVKDIKEFIYHIYNKEKYIFGKNFIYNPKLHKFNNEDKMLVKMLLELFEQDNIKHGWYKNGLGIFDKKKVFLTDNQLKRFLKTYEDTGFDSFIYNGNSTNGIITQDNIGFEFNINNEKNKLVLDIKADSKIEPIVLDASYVFYNDSIVRLDEDKRKNIYPFLNITKNTQKSRHIFEGKNKGRLIREVIPKAYKAGKVKIQDEVNELIVEEPLQCKIYLDKNKDKITAKIIFNYGKIAIMPYLKNSFINENDDKVYLTDNKKEEEIKNLFQKYIDFDKDGILYLKRDDDNVLDFVMHAVPKLQKSTDVYYSEEFKKIRIKRKINNKTAVRIFKDSDMLELDFELNDVGYDELNKIMESVTFKKKYFRLKNGEFIDLESNDVRKFLNVLKAIDAGKKELEKGSVLIPKARAVYIDKIIRENNMQQVEKNNDFIDFVKNITKPLDLEAKVPKKLEKTLRDYQKFGFKWLKTLKYYGLGGILADDMGLGKTLQFLSVILSDKEKNETGISLIIVPTSLIYNWCAEIEKFTPSLNVLPVAGNKDEREKLIKGIKENDIVITSYPLIRRDIKMYEKYVYEYIILDEAQHIKNPDSISAKCCKKLKGKSRFALTGTPMENNLMELWSIFDFVLPGFLYKYETFKKKYERPLILSEQNNTLEALNKMIQPFVLRRLKNDVLDELPPRIENKIVVELETTQKKLYYAYVKKAKEEMKEEIEKQGFEKSRIKIFALLTRLRQICCHPGVFVDNYKGGSGKLETLSELIDELIEGGHRILVFSQFTAMLSIISKMLDHKKLEYSYLDGKTPAKERLELAENFNNGQGKLFLISLKAGGTGLNLIGADTVIHFDPWWNPAVEDQASDRAYRIGQKKTVHVIRLVTKGTIEEKIDKLKEKKKKIFDSVIKPGETIVSSLTKKELEELFS